MKKDLLCIGSKKIYQIIFHDSLSGLKVDKRSSTKAKLGKTVMVFIVYVYRVRQKNVHTL